MMIRVGLALLVAMLAGCQGEDGGHFDHQGEYALEWKVEQSDCAAAVTLPDLLYAGQYPDNYPGDVDGLAAASFYYAVGTAPMTAMDSGDFGADSITLPDFTMATKSAGEAMAGFTISFGDGEASATVNATRANGCKTVYKLKGKLNGQMLEGIP